MQMKSALEKTSYEKMGIAAMLPGLILAIETLQAKVDQLRTIVSPENEIGDSLKTIDSIGRIVKDPIVRSNEMKNYWAKMTPEERSKEMKRRAKLGTKRKMLAAKKIA